MWFMWGGYPWHRERHAGRCRGVEKLSVSLSWKEGRDDG